MDALLHDFRYALRRLLRAPGFAIVAIITLALGIGANTAIFSLINALLLKPLPGVIEPDRVVTLFTSDFSSSLYSASSYPDYEDFRAQDGVFSDVIALTTSPINIARADQVERVMAEIVTANYFSMLGLKARAGRLFTDSDGAGAPVLVLSEATWRARYGADPTVLGSTVQVNGHAFTVIGIAARSFQGVTSGLRTDAWVPLKQATHIVGEPFTERGSRGFSVLGRLAPGVSVVQAQQRMSTLQQRLFETYPDEWTNLAGNSRTLTVMTEREARIPPDQRGGVFTLAAILLATVAFVLLICCANVANLLLARAAARQREIVIRYSLGAARGLVMRQLFVESAVLALMGGAGGLLMSAWTTDVLLARQGSTAMPIFLDASVDVRVLLFTVAVCIVTAVLFGLAPALRSTRADLAMLLKTERTLGSGERIRLRDALVGAQIALALVLSVGAALFTRTLREAREVDVGVDTDRVVVARFDLNTQGYDASRQREFYRELRTRLEQNPDVAGVTYAQRIPIADAGGRRGVSVTGYAPREGEEMEFPFNVVAADYFETMGLEIVRGRSFNEADRAGSAPVIVVNESFARRFWPNQEPIGQEVSVGRNRGLAVIGVARDGKYWSITEQPRPYFYLASEQEPAPLTLHVRARTDQTRVQRNVREVVRGLDPLLPILVLDAMEGQMMGALLPQRIAGGLVGVFALLAILLAGIGVYGVTSVLVVQRVPEIGLRVALGATSLDVLRLVVGRAMIVAGVGIIVGAVLAAFATRAIASLLFGVSPLDALSFGTSALILGAAAGLAAYLPARRALRVHPIEALTS